MNEFLKGNFKVKRPVVESAPAKDSASTTFKDEYKKKALASVGGSMVFVEMDHLSWDGDASPEPKKP
jgi:hypothetical protein